MIKVVQYYETIQERRVLSNVAPGYLRQILPPGPPEQGQPWNDIQADIESKIMPGLTHWYVEKNIEGPRVNIRLSGFKAVPPFHGVLSCLDDISFNAR